MAEGTFISIGLSDKVERAEKKLKEDPGLLDLYRRANKLDQQGKSRLQIGMELGITMRSVRDFLTFIEMSEKIRGML